MHDDQLIVYHLVTVRFITEEVFIHPRVTELSPLHTGAFNHTDKTDNLIKKKENNDSLRPHAQFDLCVLSHAVKTHHSFYDSFLDPQRGFRTALHTKSNAF